MTALKLTSCEVEVYKVGLCYLSACAPKALDKPDVEMAVNDQSPTGLDHGWSVSDEPFSGGQTNPCECNHDAARQHWLLSC